MRYVHAAVSMNPSPGVAQQMTDEGRAASELDIDWMVWLSKGEDLQPATTLWRSVLLRYMVLRVRFYLELARLSRQGRVILLRHSHGDPFLFLASFFLGPYFTVHHTLEEFELETSKFPFSRLQLLLERVLGRRVVARARGIVCMTPEIAQHQLSRLPSHSAPPVFIYPNGVLYPDRPDESPDNRKDRIEVLFVASYFYGWHGLELLLDAMKGGGEDGILHLVGTLPDHARQIAKADARVRMHGHLDHAALDSLVAQCWLGLSSFSLFSKGMTEACTLKVRDYLRAGLPVYAGHRDTGLPENFGYFRQGPPQWKAIVEYARDMRSIPRAAISVAARPFIDKKGLLEQLHRTLEVHHRCS